MEKHTPATASRVLRILLAFAALAAGGPAAAAAQSGGSSPSETPPGGTAPTAPVSPDPPGTVPIAFRGDGMWIWQLPRVYGGSVPRIVAKARRHNIRTLFIKSGDGTKRWRQFSPGMVSAFKAAGLRVCGWQYVYGRAPIGEANVSAAARRAGADCFVIDAESEYEGRYVAADQYMRRLRALVGQTYPIGFTSFPYVHFHPSLPYSVFLAPGAAGVNQPQMYWHTIGASVDTNFATTYTWNRIYERPILPLGQTYDRAPTNQIRRFRQLATAYRADGVSWWEWTFTSEARWRAVSDPVVSLTQYRPSTSHPRLRLRSKGDPVVWAQQHLWSAGYRVPLDGIYGAGTRNAVVGFQTQRGLSPTGVLDDATWQALLRLEPVVVRWRTSRGRAKAFPARAAGRSRAVTAPAPASAALPARRYEIPRKS